MEAWKLLTGTGTALVGHVLYLDALQMEWHKLTAAAQSGLHYSSLN